jgi:hypothetical protein
MKKFFVKTALAGGLALVLALGACENPAGDDGDDGDPLLTGTVTLTGLARVGETLSADAFALDGEGDITYTWLRGDTAIAGVSGLTYELTEDDLSYRVKVRVSRSGYTGSVDSNAVGLVSADPFTGIADIRGYLETAAKGTDAETPAFVAAATLPQSVTMPSTAVRPWKRWTSRRQHLLSRKPGSVCQSCSVQCAAPG